MNLNKHHLTALQTDLRDVTEALLADQVVWLAEPGIGWVITKMVNVGRPRADYHIGVECPEYNARVA